MTMTTFLSRRRARADETAMGGQDKQRRRSEYANCEHTGGIKGSSSVQQSSESKRSRPKDKRRNNVLHEVALNRESCNYLTLGRCGANILTFPNAALSCAQKRFFRRLRVFLERFLLNAPLRITANTHAPPNVGDVLRRYLSTCRQYLSTCRCVRRRTTSPANQNMFS